MPDETGKGGGILKIKIIDLSQDVYQGMPLYPIHQKTFIFTNVTHEETKKMLGIKNFDGFGTRNLIINEHAGTHCDAVWEYNLKGATIEKMPLGYFCGEAICLDVSHVPSNEFIRKKDIEQALEKARLEIKRGDIVLLYTGHFNKWYGTPKYVKEYPGLDKEAAYWLADKGVVNIGIDTPSIDNPTDTDFSGHLMCSEKHLTNTENMANLDKVVNKRFLFVGLPLKIRGGSGSPIRAAAIFFEE